MTNSSSLVPRPSSPRYEAVIGLEVHAQLATRTKIFCACPVSFGSPPNSNVCPVCAGLPGSLPVLNRRAFELGLRAVVALGGNITPRVKFDRKNYFYPDLPKNYQISQYDLPVGKGGFIELVTAKGVKRINLVRVHLEEDAGKLMHESDGSYVDLNRAGTPLIEIVSEPELAGPDEAYAYLVNLKAILKAIGVSDADMEKGHLRCDANVSVRKSASEPLGTRVEIKNLNSFKYVRSAIEHEIKRQTEALASGARIVQETRLWDDAAQKTVTMRSKEEAHDYRYFPEPDLVPFQVDMALVKTIRETMPELPVAKKKKFREKYGLGDYDADILLGDEALTARFESLAGSYSNYKTLANWLIGPVLAYMNENRIETRDLKLSAPEFVELLALVDSGAVSHKAAKEHVFPEFIRSGASPKKIVQEKGLGQISDSGLLDTAIGGAIEKNPKSVSDFLAGKDNALQFLIGQVMRETKGKANPNLVSEMIRKKLKG